MNFNHGFIKKINGYGTTGPINFTNINFIFYTSSTDTTVSTITIFRTKQRTLATTPVAHQTWTLPASIFTSLT
ncbi:unnamed protein product [Acanthoscelides obtectus]|uniref:Uncharacterized protein n=1 Tax=Acanthoscelides obtectus TaxID=200917 RepID=A0A9P0MGB4_ACAOB|nr:unnamed protein product [Acanthoscelides obtectus]CAK1677807.1 hypothetical protein AOBTE_LOCUS31567 [Acanthoscelides obtectus]